MRTPAGHKVYAMAAEYPSAPALYEAAKRVRDAGFRRWDVYSPFPIHGMDEAMGLGKSWLSGWVLFGGVSGLLTAALVEFGPSSFLYPLDVHGKPTNFFTVPAFFPIMFELTVLFGAFAAFFAMLTMNGLPRWYHPMFNWQRFMRVTNDGFFLAIEARDPRFTETGVRELLEKSGGQHITIVHEDQYVARIPINFAFVHHRDHCGVRISWTKKHRLAPRNFSGHGAPDESARTSATQFFFRWARSPSAGHWHIADWLRNANTQNDRYAGCHHRHS